MRHEVKLPVAVAVVDDGAPTSTAAAKAFAARYRGLGGKVPFEATWAGDPDGLGATVKGLASHFPRPHIVFYAGGAESAGRLVLAMRAEKALRDADLIGLPPVFEAPFFDTTRLKGMRTRAVFPCPDYQDAGTVTRELGFAFQRSSPEYKAYIHFAYRRPGHWDGMLFDGAALAAKAYAAALKRLLPPDSAPAASSPSAQASVGLSPTVQGGASATAQAEAGPPASVQAKGGTAAAPTREDVRLALLAIDGYRGIRGAVKFGASREPVEPRAMVYLAWNRVNRKEMQWKNKAFGPPF
jgi:hypothetical protein